MAIENTEKSIQNNNESEMKVFIDGEWKNVEIKRPEPEETYDLYSEKYDVKGRIDDYSFVIKLSFGYSDRQYVIGIQRPFDGDIAGKGVEILEEVIERLSDEPNKAALHYWYLDSKDGSHSTESWRIHSSSILRRSWIQGLMRLPKKWS